MDFIELIFEALPFAAAIFAFVYGAVHSFHRGTALYFQIIVCAVGCFALGKLFGLVSFLTAGGLPERFHVGYLGIFGCYFFLFSANYGQMDGLIDDKSCEFSKYRRISFAAPLILMLSILPIFFSSVTVGMKIITITVLLPALPTAYFNLKHTLIPDMGFGFVKAIRPCNICALVLLELSILELVCSACGILWMESVATILISVACVLLVFAAERGTKQWSM